MEPDLLLIYTMGGGFLLFVLMMAFGGHVLPTGNMMRDPTRKGDIAIAFFSLIAIIFLIWVAFGGWQHFFGVAPPKTPEAPLITPIATQNVTHIVALNPAAATQPAVAKRQLRRYCRDFLEQPGNTAAQCVVFMWQDNRRLPRGFPIPPASLTGMTANYVYNRVGDIDRFCWLTNGRVIAANCF